MAEATGSPELDALAARVERIPSLDAAQLEAEHIALLGRKQGAITELLKRLPQLPLEQRKDFGAKVNELKERATVLFALQRIGSEAERKSKSPCDRTDSS